MNFKHLISITIILISFSFNIQAAPAPGTVPLEPQPAIEPFQRVDLARMEGFRRDLTVRFLDQFRDPGLRRLLATRLGPDQTRVSLTRLVDDWAERWPSAEHRQFAARIQELDLDLRQRMGIEDSARTILGLNLIWPGSGAQPVAWERTLFAVRPHPGGPSPDHVEAYDSAGRMVRLDPALAPEVPVVMIGADRREAVRAGLETVNLGLRRAGFADDHRPAAPAPVDCGKLTAIRLAKGHEHWYDDPLDPYALVSGIDPVEAKPNIKLVQLPYLRHENIEYTPNHVLLFWSDFRFSAANIQFWNHGDGTNYRDILDAVLKGAAGATVAGGAPMFAWIPALADAIIMAMPTSWWSTGETLLDTFYTLEKGQTYQERNGVSNGVRITLAPWVLQPQ